jgi:hypothetical protein
MPQIATFASLHAPTVQPAGNMDQAPIPANTEPAMLVSALLGDKIKTLEHQLAKSLEAREAEEERAAAIRNDNAQIWRLVVEHLKRDISTVEVEREALREKVAHSAQESLASAAEAAMWRERCLQAEAAAAVAVGEQR